MTWRNIFDLGPVEILWEDTTTGALRPLSELVGGTIDVVDGVIQCTGLRSPFIDEPNAVQSIVVVPQFDAAELPMRLSVPSFNRPSPGGASGMDISGAVGSVAGDAFTGSNFVFLEPVWQDGIPLTVAIGVTPDSQVPLGTTPAAASPAGQFFAGESLT